MEIPDVYIQALKNTNSFRNLYKTYVLRIVYVCTSM